LNHQDADVASTPIVDVPAAHPDRTGRRRILVVDDDQAIRDVLLDLLTDEGYDARTADGGIAALAVLPLWQPDLILLDLHLLDIDAWAFRHQLHPAFATVPVLVLTANPRAEDQVEQPAVPVLLKPFELDELLGTIQHLMIPTER
jgi:CheY-like chemotaxis protein